MLGTRFNRHVSEDTSLVTKMIPLHPLRIGLTGGIGCGKTTVCDLFEQLGVNIIDADLVAREVVQPDEEAYKEIVETFGSNILSKNREIDRKKLRELVFGHPEKLQQLEKITHPRIISNMRDQVSKTTSPYCILCIPLLFEKKLQEEVDRVLVVDIPVEVQKQRVASRDEITLDQVATIMGHQLERKQRLSLANDVITNDGLISDLQSQVNTLHKQYMATAETHERQRAN